MTTTMDLLGKMATKQKAAKPKGGKPVLHDPELDDQIAAYIEHSQAAKSSETLANAAKDQIVQRVAPFRLEVCHGEGKVVASVGVNGRLTFTQTCRYSAVPEERTDDLKDAFGDRFGRYFSETLQIGLQPAAANDEAVLTQLLEKVGRDFFQKHFEVRRDLLVKEEFHRAISCEPAVREVARPFLEDQTVRPYQASLKIA